MNNNQCACHGGCCGSRKTEQKTLNIVWQRLVESGDTCPRCGSTESELDEALILLKNTLEPIGIIVKLEKIEISLEEFKKNPSTSNAILMNGVALEKLIEAKTGQSRCCDVCGDEECRTLEVGGETYEIIPKDLILRAGLIAAGNIS